MRTEPYWVRLNIVLQIHSDQIIEHGGDDRIRDVNLLQSALAKPENIFAYNLTADVQQLAAAYGFGISQNHPFIDGNKRTAYVCMETFLPINGHTIVANQDEKYDMVIKLASGSIKENELSEWLRANTEQIN